jgi:hypothetical protein
MELWECSTWNERLASPGPDTFLRLFQVKHCGFAAPLEDLKRNSVCAAN